MMKKVEDLLLTGRESIGVQVPELQSCKHQLNRGGGVGVGGGIDDRQLHPRQSLFHHVISVPGRIIG